MVIEDLVRWAVQTRPRLAILAAIRQPSTASQLARVIDARQGQCSRALSQLEARSLAFCLTPSVQRSRIFWLTSLGLSCQRTIRSRLFLPPLLHSFQELDWRLYSWVIYRHRSAILKAFQGPMTPSDIKRRAMSQSCELRISGNNVRDILKLFIERGIVTRIPRRRRHRAQFELTETGKQLQDLLWQAEIPLSCLPDLRTGGTSLPDPERLKGGEAASGRQDG